MAKLPDPWRTLIGEINALKREVAELKRRSPYAGTGMAPNGENGVQVDGDLIVDGNLRLDGAGTVGGTWKSADFDGDLAAGNAGTKGWAFNSLRAAIGELFLRPGSIGNDILTQPVIPAMANASSSGFGITTNWAEVVGQNVTVPAGCTRLLATVTGWVYANNFNTTGGFDGAGSDTVFATVTIASFVSEVYGGNDMKGSGGSSTATTGLSRLLTGLTPGSTIHVGVGAISTAASLGSSPYNTATLSGSLLFLR